jgi:hypothetical protein
MTTIRRLMQASNFDGVGSLFGFIKRGAWIGLIWANFLGILVCGILLSAMLAAVCYVAYRGGPLGGAAKPLVAIPPIYALMCGWGVVIGACFGAVRRLFHRSPDPGREAGG